MRLDKLLEIRDLESYIILSTGYTRHKPPFLDEHGFPVTECRVAASALLNRGVERSKILLEEISSDTIGNLYFSMLLFVQPPVIEMLSTVTSRFHVARVQAAAEWICSLSGWKVVPSIELQSAPDPEMSCDAESLVRAKEAEGIRNIKGLRCSIQTAEDMCCWLHTQHTSYRADAQPAFSPTPLGVLY
jgi:hypothetical protein